MKKEILECMLLPDGHIYKGRMSIVDGRIDRLDLSERCEPSESSDLSASVTVPEEVIVPGFIDVHVHGGGGADVMDGTSQALDQMTATHAARGTSGLLATTVTASNERILSILDTVSEYTKRFNPTGSKILGVHLEGPYLNPRHRGAQNEQYMVPPSIDQFKRWLERGQGIIKMMTIAPEMEGADEVIREAVDRGIVISAGHTDATWSQMEHAVAQGVSHLTHLFNAMRPLHHREPGIVGYAMHHPSLTADFIVDGIHLDPRTVDLVISKMGVDRLLLITDAMRAACMDDGIYDIGELRVTVKDGAARIDNGSLAGSLLTLQEAYHRVMTLHGRSWHEASLMASYNPAKLLGLSESKGLIQEGMDADLVCLDRFGNTKWTMVEGETVFMNNLDV